MLHNTRGIVLHTVKFSETSLVAKIYTEAFGLQSYLVKGILKPRSKMKPALFQHMCLVDLVVTRKEKGTLHSIREIQVSDPYRSLPFEIRKSSIALFINELLYRSVHEEDPNAKLFTFIRESCLLLDRSVKPMNNFPLWFAIHLTAFLGFMPRMNYSDTLKIFNMKDGLFQENIPEHAWFMDWETSALFAKLLEASSDSQSHLVVTLRDRNLMLEKILAYYKLHLPGFPGLQSPQVLHTVLG
jgi:DNA repair protein RecO (recombination protein O)